MRDSATISRDLSVGSPQRPIRVLLVEDDRLDRMVLERFVLRNRLPYEIVSAESGMDAQQLLRSRVFDVVLLDYMLGDMTGLELLPELRGMPGIFITGMGTEEIAADAMRLGAHGYLVKDTDHAYLNMLPVLIGNVLERKRAEDSLRQTQRRLAALLGNLAGMDYRSAPTEDRALVVVGGSSEELVGYSPTELTAAEAPPLSSLIDQEDRVRVASALTESLASGRALDCTYRLRTRDGGWKWVRDRAALIRNDDGTPAAFEGLLVDVSSQATAEDIVRRAKQESEEAALARDRLMALVVHDLRAPLSTLLLSVQQLRMELTDFADSHGLPQGTDKRMHFAQLFDAMTDRGQDMLRMIDQLLLTSRLRSGVLTPAMRPITTSRLRAMANALQPLAQQKQLTLTTDLPERFKLLADPDLLAEVLQNIITNAIKFTNPGGTIHMGALPDGQHGFYVRDTGVGIAPERLPHLFYREERSTTLGTVGERGTGMGLSMSREIVEAHGGRIEAESTVGKGTEFRVRLPTALPRLVGVALGDAEVQLAKRVVGELEGEFLAVAGPEDTLRISAKRLPQAVLVDGATAHALRTLRDLRADTMLRNVPLLWLGPPDPPLGTVPDEQLSRPLDPAALRTALRLPFGG